MDERFPFPRLRSPECPGRLRIRKGGGPTSPGEYPRNRVDSIQQWLSSLPQEAHIGMESTGAYHRLSQGYALAADEQCTCCNLETCAITAAQ